MRLLAILLVALLVSSPLRASEPEACDAGDALPESTLCIDGEVVDCAAPTGRIPSLVCADAGRRALEAEVDALYARLLASLAKPSPEGMDHEAARVALVASQEAWRRYVEQDCALGDALFGLGNGGPAAGIDCRIGHAEARVQRLRLHLGIAP